MKLTNCESRAEKALKEVDLERLESKVLVSLAKIIQKGFMEEKTYEDEEIVISALVQIAEELGRRVG